MTAKLTMRAFWFLGFAAITYASVAAEPSDTDSPHGGRRSCAKTKVQPRTQTAADDRFAGQVPSGTHRQVGRDRRNLWVNGLQIRRANLTVVFNRGKASGLVNRWLDDSLVDLKRILQSFGIEFPEKANKDNFSIVVGGPVPRALAAAVEAHSR